MNPMLGNTQQSLFNINQLHYTAMNVVETFCGIVCRPVELIIRPFHGTRYFQPTVIFFATLMMLFIPIFSAAASAAVSMIPFTHVAPPVGMFSIASLAKLYFLLSMVHGVRIFGRMVNPASEKHSEYEGPPLPFFYLLPGGRSFWFTRIVLEPSALIAAAIVLERVFIIQSGLATFLEFSALALAMKEYIGWYKAWEQIRILLDMQFAAPIIASLLQDQATDSDLAAVHLASFPKKLAPEIRKSAARRLARILFGWDERDEQ